jgi:hypothetical protein
LQLGEDLPPDEAVVPNEPPTGSQCWYEYLGDWIRCEDTGWPNSVDIGAETLQECANACLLDEACVSVTDYFWLGLEGLGCSLVIGECEMPATTVWAEEDGGKEYVKVCGDDPPDDAITYFEHQDGVVVDPDSGCVFKAVGYPLVCEGHAETPEEIVGADTLDECFQLCQQRDDCRAVKDWWEGTRDGFECQLHWSTCDAPEPWSGDPVYYYRKTCE